MHKFAASFFLLATGIILSSASAEESYSPHDEQSYPTNAYWGDTHLHGNMSLDAHGLGDKTITRDDAYRFAKGEAETAHNGMKVRFRPSAVPK